MTRRRDESTQGLKQVDCDSQDEDLENSMFNQKRKPTKRLTLQQKLELKKQQGTISVEEEAILDKKQGNFLTLNFCCFKSKVNHCTMAKCFAAIVISYILGAFLYLVMNPQTIDSPKEDVIVENSDEIDILDFFVDPPMIPFEEEENSQEEKISEQEIQGIQDSMKKRAEEQAQIEKRQREQLEADKKIEDDLRAQLEEDALVIEAEKLLQEEIEADKRTQNELLLQQQKEAMERQKQLAREQTDELLEKAKVHKEIKDKQGDNKDPLDRVMYAEMERRQNDLRLRQEEKDKKVTSSQILAEKGDLKYFEDSLKLMIEQSKGGIFMISKSYCPFCNKTKEILKEKNLTDKAVIVEIDLLSETSKIQDALKNITGQRTVPNIFMNGQHVGGYDQLNALNNSGRLADMISELNK